MKKSNKIIVALLSVLLVLLLVITGVTALRRHQRATAVTADVSWYDENGKEFSITTAEQLYGVAQLSESHDFKGQTIKLDADITVNEGDAKDWVKKAPERLWIPITGFAGTFDGQGHTISGIYGDSIITSLGLFTDTQKTCVIKDLQLVNSCFKNNNTKGTGSIIGVGGGKLENIYSDAVISSAGKYVGGFIGRVTTKGENQITNCWFDGTITMKGVNTSEVGGIVGAFTVEDAINAIQHCLSTADITCKGVNVGGICGNLGSNSFVNLIDSMYTGTLDYDTNNYDKVGSAIGQITGGSSAIIKDTYTVDEIANRTIGTTGGYQEGSAIAVGAEELIGIGGYQWTTLDFDKYWAVQKDDTPILAHFAENSESVAGAERLVDISWYNPTGMNFEIKNMQQFYGFAYLSRSYDFSGQTIKLGADITVNEGNAEDWQDEAPKYKWTPIAWHGTSLSKRFKGNFDGQGHTISGIYCVGDEDDGYIGLFGEIYHGSVVKNFKIVNSYFEGTMASTVRGTVGSVCGRLRGTIDSVYSNAIIVNSARMTGGMAGMINGTGQNTISNCWFDGKITGISRTGGILGGVYGNKANIEATIEHCLNTGEIAVEIGKGDVGGICGMAETWCTLYITDCLNTGTFKTIGDDKKANTHIGTIFGSVTETSGVGSKVFISNSFGTKEFYSKLVGWKYDDAGISQSSVAFVSADEVKGFGGYQWTTLDFKNSWAVRTEDVPVPVVFAGTRPSVSGVARMVDYSWYDADKDVLTIKNYQQLYAAARLWDVTNQFKGKTIKLGADIVVNEGNAADWAEKAPALVWEPMRFNGTFDGQGHSISGIYVKGGEEDNYVGLFYRIYQDGVVKNLKLVNSYIEGTMASNKRGAVGSIAGRSNGVIDGVYSDAIVVNSARMTGGIVGMITGEGKNIISNTWFDRQVTGVSRTGGILGGVYGNKENLEVSLEHCLNTGDIAVQIGYGDVGGLCGMVETGGILNLTDSLNAGTFTTVGEGKEPSTHIGNLVGSVTKTEDASSKVNMKHVYGVNEFYSKLVGWSYAGNAVTKSSVAMADKAKLNGNGGYQWTTLDFEKYWATRTEDVPVLLTFAGGASGVVGVNRLIDISWYDENVDEYIITTPEQLYGFNLLCDEEHDYFAGKTVKLGADITLNSGEASEWAKTAPTNVWTPGNFLGTFDGQGHTISGVYVKGGAEDNYIGFFARVYKGGTVKDLKLTNSYFEGTMASNQRGAVGSIAGRNNGTTDSVYSDAIVVNSARMTGGIVGMITGEGENKISNSWFDGEITGVTRTGGILGGIYGNKANIEVTLEHCLNTGDISVPFGVGDVGGLCGMIETGGTLKLTDSLNAGTFATVGEGKKENTHVGTLVGSVGDPGEAETKVVMKHAYGVEEFYNRVVGWTYDDKVVSKSAVSMLDMIKINGNGGYQWTTLDFDKYWAVRTNDVPALLAFASGTSVAGIERMLSWYDENKDEYVITTKEQLIGFNFLCDSEHDYFAGKTVKLGADITLNAGDATDWAEKAPANVWVPTNFKGTFDGQGHTLSGIYVKGTGTYTGFFGTISSGAVVQNLNLENSYIEGTKTSGRCGTGSIAGLNQGTIDRVYSNAIVKNSALMTGGIAGMTNNVSETENKITNCWFDGQIYANGNTGGILGGTYKSTATIDSCLNTGILNIDADSEAGATAVGGLLGYAQSTSDVTLTDSLNAGSFVQVNSKEDSDAKVKQVGSLVGANHGDAAMDVSDSFGNHGFAEKKFGYKGGDVTISDSANVYVTDLNGMGAYQWTTLDFEDEDKDGAYWVLREDKLPVLNIYEQGDLDVADAKELESYTWYDAELSELFIEDMYQFNAFLKLYAKDSDYFAGKTVLLDDDIKELNITTPEELFAINILCNSGNEYLAGRTIKLGQTIDLNPNWTASSTTEPTNEWTPVIFAGTFDGQGNTIRGLYVNNNSKDGGIGLFAKVEDGATVKDLRLENGYVKAVKIVGSVAGRLAGTMENVYSSVIVESAGNATGGLVGMMDTPEADNKITSCWYDGEIILTAKARGVGGLLGQVNHNSETIEAWIEGSLNTGKVTVEENVTATNVGGLCGFVHKNVDLSIVDSLNAGTISGNGTVSEEKGSVVGYVNTEADSMLTLTNVYGTAEFADKICCSGIVTISDNSVAMLVNEDDIKGYGAYQWMRFDFENDWSLRSQNVPMPKAFGDGDLNVSDASNLPSFTWYDANATELEIETVQELLGFSILGQTKDFAGQTITLAKDAETGAVKTYDLNPNWTAGSTTKPTNVWTPVKNFKGTFDGQGNTIRGLYVSQPSSQDAGMFARVYGTVKNFRLENSYVKGSKMAGSIAGHIDGTIDSIYSNAIVSAEGNAVGGIAGMCETNKGDIYITNCWFEGAINSNGNYVGGILGYAYRGSESLTVNISNCLNEGTIEIAGTKESEGIGGICGAATKIAGVELKINNSLNAGTFTNSKTGKGSVTSLGTLVGLVTNAKVTLTNAYGTTEFATAVCGSSTGTVTGGECYDKLLLTGANAYHQTNLNFAEEGGTWSLREDEVPAPRVFVSENEIAIPSQKADLLIHDPDSLLEFATNSSEYEDELILLVADIDLNPNWTASTNCEEPTNIWTPIASFKGTFDGQGHTIRGLYVSQTSTSNIGMFKAVYGTVKNFRLENSYIKGQKMVGSIAGQIEGTIDLVYSSAIVSAVENAIGGIAGMNQNPSATITNCWFAGEVSTSKNYVGGILGYIYNKGNVEISHCLNTGNVTGGQQVGGICGYVQGKDSNKAKLDIIDSLSDATCSGTKQVGVIVGAIGDKGKLTVGNVYGTQTSESQKLYGFDSNNVTVSTGTEVKLVAANEIKGLETKASGLTFYQNNTFVEEDSRTCWWIARENKIPMLADFKDLAATLDK